MVNAEEKDCENMLVIAVRYTVVKNWQTLATHPISRQWREVSTEGEDWLVLYTGHKLSSIYSTSLYGLIMLLESKKVSSIIFHFYYLFFNIIIKFLILLFIL